MFTSTSRPLTETRFKAILAAYGADAKRWPDVERQPALDFMAAHPVLAGALLADAARLDHLLDGLTHGEAATFDDNAQVHWKILGQTLAEISALDEDETDNVVSLQDRRPTRLPLREGLLREGRPLPLLWATGIGLAACIAGAAFGVNISQSGLGDVRAQTVLDQAQMVYSED